MIEDVCTHGVGVAAAGGEVERRGVVPVQQVDVHPLVLRKYIHLRDTKNISRYYFMTNELAAYNFS